MCPSGVDNLCGHRFTQRYEQLPVGYDHKYVYSHFGYNLKATDMQAAVGCAQLKKLPAFIQKRRCHYDHLKAGLEGYTDKFIFSEPCKNANPSWFGFLMTCRPGVARSRIVPFIENRGVQTRMLFAGNLIKHPCFDEMRASGKGYRVVGKLEGTDTIMKDTFWVGVYPGMTEEMLDYMIETIADACRRI